MEKTKPKIIAYEITTAGGGGMVHKKCLHPYQKPHRDAMTEAKTNCCPPNYPAVQAAWLAGHPSLPRPCCHCGEYIAREV